MNLLVSTSNPEDERTVAKANSRRWSEALQLMIVRWEMLMNALRAQKA